MFGFLWQVAAAVDSQAVQTAETAQGHAAASEVVVKNPVPGFAGRVFQFAFSMPQWLQWSLIVLGVIIGLMIVLFLFRKRAILLAWLTRQSRGYKMALAGVAAVMVMGIGGSSYAGWHYTQHNNDFCVGCHVMGTAWNAFQRSEHRKLECHSCHQQPISASVKQLYYWVLERPEKIPKHARVPTAVCSQCHVRSVADSSWKRIIATAGHRLHLNSDSSALKEVACVTCHGQEVHRFKPVDKTCGQANCHASKDTKIVLGKMSGQTSQHCTGCHTFTRPVPENISMDSTRKYLMATGSPESCFGCHEMRNQIKNFDATQDRGHQAVCGSCHNPHKQTEPKAAFATCASGGCHADLATKSPFHSAKSVHKTKNCGECHQAHQWKAIGRECADCHKNVINSRPAPRDVESQPASSQPVSPLPAMLPPVSLRPVSTPDPLRVTAVARHTTAGSTLSTRRVRRGAGRQIVPRRVAERHVAARRAVHRTGSGTKTVRFTAAAFRQAAVAKAPATAPQTARPPKDSPSFSHGIHKVLACAGCHDQKLAPGRVTVRSPAECAACHHSAERSVSCEGCHNSRTKLAKPISKAVSLRPSAGAPPESRTLTFAHQQHRDLECKGCHTNGILLGVTRDCLSCHTDHHNAERSCLACHQSGKGIHQRAAHDGCAGSGCHSNASVIALPPSRSVCLSCHADQANHKPKRECAECHAVKWGSTSPPPR